MKRRTDVMPSSWGLPYTQVRCGCCYQDGRCTSQCRDCEDNELFRMMEVLEADVEAHPAEPTHINGEATWEFDCIVCGGVVSERGETCNRCLSEPIR